ncbi:MAG: hypothetical protein BK997_05520 [Candidatus Micrarchaeum sp. ARMAN-1]|uniref:Uncharacterized protein n=1 Tax=Sulfobacillus harzensis TaxID=2729629 RepID=A0A7Y0Q447_9FIRM|nr:hypothetical protein [Sulfobacillus harzensis]NMP24963.1 hypothetical protein [Sulfobacillus harzensis]OJI06602.1 MAG: hypothetical protein BK997_05520 [Candidatus Micrarchaeum sp. ARMAN-1]
MKVQVNRKTRNVSRYLVGIAVLLSTMLIGIPGIVFAQSPTPSWFMEDSRPGNGFPSPANAIVVEGLQLGVGGCAYSLSSTEQSTVYWINHGYQTVTEVTPYAGCGSLSAYETAINSLISYVEANASNPGRYWGGIMLDEEGGYGFTPTQLESLNSDVNNHMASTSGMSWYFEEDQPNSWYASTYNQILGSSWPAPQVYTSSMADAVNTACTDYQDCTNLVTVNSGGTSPWNSPSYVTGLIKGTPWNNSEWGANGYWYNLYRNQ